MAEKKSATPTTPNIGDVVLYQVREIDVENIKTNRGRLEVFTGGELIGNPVTAGTQYPALVVAQKDRDDLNLRVLLDGKDDLWVAHAKEGDYPGCWKHHS